MSVLLCSSSIHHSPQKEVSPQNRHLRLCPKECVLIFAQIKENKLCTHSRFFICRQTSLFIIWNFPTLSLLEAQMAQVSVAKKSFFFFCNQTRANLEFSLGLKRHSRKKIKKKIICFFFLSFSSINKFGHWEYSTGWDNDPVFEDPHLAPASRIKSISGLTEPRTTCHLWATYALKSVYRSNSK